MVTDVYVLIATRPSVSLVATVAYACPAATFVSVLALPVLS